MNPQEFENAFSSLLGPTLQELEDVLNDIQRDISKRRYIVELPEPNIVDASLESLADIVAKSSNAYGRIARFAGKCRAEYDLAAGRYKRIYEESGNQGNNEASRRKNAMVAARDAHIAMTVAEAAYHYAEKLENSARVASESARKIYDKVAAMWMAQGREDHGSHQDNNEVGSWVDDF